MSNYESDPFFKETAKSPKSKAQKELEMSQLKDLKSAANKGTDQLQVPLNHESGHSDSGEDDDHDRGHDCAKNRKFASRSKTFIPSATVGNPDLLSVNKLNSPKKKMIKRPLAKNEEFVDYKYVTEEGITKRNKIIKRTVKMVKQLTEE